MAVVDVIREIAVRDRVADAQLFGAAFRSAGRPRRCCLHVPYGTQGVSLRRALVCRDAADAAQALGHPESIKLISGIAPERSRAVIFLFSGQGSQYTGMGRGLYESEPAFTNLVDFAANFCGKLLVSIYAPCCFLARRMRNRPSAYLTRPTDSASAFRNRICPGQTVAIVGNRAQGNVRSQHRRIRGRVRGGRVFTGKRAQIVAERGRLMQSCRRAPWLP